MTTPVVAALGLLALGTGLILAALWNRDEPRRALVLFVLGALAVVAGGIAAVHAAQAPAAG